MVRVTLPSASAREGGPAEHVVRCLLPQRACGRCTLTPADWGPIVTQSTCSGSVLRYEARGQLSVSQTMNRPTPNTGALRGEHVAGSMQKDEGGLGRSTLTRRSGNQRLDRRQVELAGVALEKPMRSGSFAWAFARRIVREQILSPSRSRRRSTVGRTGSESRMALISHLAGVAEQGARRRRIPTLASSVILAYQP